MQQVQNTSNNTNRAADWLRANAIKIIAIVFWLALIGLIIAYQRSTGLGPQELAADLAQRLSDTIAGTWWGPIVYSVIYFLRPLILFPASLLTILAGNLYGLALGIPIGVFAGTLSAIIPYFAGRWLFASKDDAPEAAQSNQLQKFAGTLRDNPFQTVLIMRLLFLPYDAMSIFVGSLKIGFWPFFIATALGNMVGAIPYIALGASVQGNPFTADVEFNPWIFALAAVMMVLSIGVSRLIKRRQPLPTEDTAETA